MDNDIEIYSGKTFSELCKDIVENSNMKKNQIDIIVSDIRPMMKDVDSALRLLPMVREYLDCGVKNDEQLVKLAAIIQKILNRSTNGDDNDEAGLTDAEKKQLMLSLEETKHLVKPKTEK